MRRHCTAAALRILRPQRWRYFREVSANQWLDRESLQRLHDDRLTAILRYAVTNVPRYRQYAASKGWRAAEISNEDIVNLPFVDKKLMTDELDSFLAENVPEQHRRIGATGGSTGVWFRFFGDKRVQEIGRAYDLLGRTWAGWRVGEPQATVWGHPGDMEAAEAPRSRILNALLHRLITLNAWQIEDAALRIFIERLMIHRPTLLIGYASALAFLAETMRDRGITGVRPRGIISAAQYLSDEQRAVIENYFGCKVLNRYGSREFGNMAQQCEHAGGFHVFSDRVHMELVRPDGSPCQPGERGEITITAFNNRVMPFIRYRTGDLAVASDEACPCGRKQPMIARVEGRVSELIVGLNGRVYSCPGPALWMKGMVGIHQLQIYQPDRESIEARVVPDAQWSEEAARLLTARCHELLGPVHVSIVLRDEIPVSPSGKYRFAISEVSPFNRPGVSDPSH